MIFGIGTPPDGDEYVHTYLSRITLSPQTLRLVYSISSLNPFIFNSSPNRTPKICDPRVQCFAKWLTASPSEFKGGARHDSPFLCSSVSFFHTALLKPKNMLLGLALRALVESM